MVATLRVLLVEDLPTDAELEERELRRAGIEFVSQRVETREDLLAALEDFTPDIILCDSMLPTFDGMTALKLARERSPNVPVIIVTGSMNEGTAIECLKAGAEDYVIKEHLTRLGPALKNALKQQLQREVKQRAFKALRESEERFRAVSEGAPDAFVTADERGIITFWNSAAEAIFGHTKDEAIGQSLTILIPERYRAAHLAGFDRFNSTGEPRIVGSVVELMGLGKDGREFPLEMSLSTWRSGSTTRFNAIIRDITERREAEEAVRHMASLPQQNPNPVIEVDETGTVVLMNPAAEQHFPDLAGSGPRHPVLADLAQIVSVLRRSRKDWLEREIVANGRTYEQKLCRTPTKDRIRIFCHDITERKEAEEIVERLVLRQQLILDSAGQGIVGVDSDGKMTFVNLAAASMLGGTVSELLGKPLQPRKPDSGPDAKIASDYSSTVDQTLVDGLHREADAFFQRLDGTSFPVRLVCTAIGKGDKTDGAVVVFEDVSERKEREEALSLQGAALEAAANSIVITDCEGVIQWVNSAFTKLTGYTAEEAIGQNSSVLKSERQDRAFYVDLWDTVIAGKTWCGELINKRKNGSVYTEEMTITPVPDECGNITHFVAIKQDITERKETEETLRKSEESFRNLVRHATYGIYRSSPDGRFLSVNPALVEMLGYESEEDLLSIDMNEDLYADQATRQALIDEFRLSRLVDGVEIPWLRRGGNPVVVRLSGRPIITPNGDLECFEMIVENVTERNKLEMQLRQAQKMEAIGNLTGGLAHDFNNLLSVIIANTEILTESLAHEDLQLLAKDISTAADAGAQMVRQLLGFSRIAVLEMHTINLSKVVADTSSMLKRLIPSNIEFDVTTDHTVRNVYADSALVQQIILNLATNARDAMPNGGNLSIEVQETIVNDDMRQSFPWFVPGEYVLVAVADTGTGMDEETRSKIFEPFFTTKPKGSGTGLGMAMVYGLMKQQRGYILVESKLGMGTTMELYFPISSKQEHTAEHHQVAAKPERLDGNETVLYVEDQDALLRTGTRVLERNGYTVISAANGREAVEKFREHRSEIDIVLCDMVMPEMGGAEVVRTVREIAEDTPFLMVTGYAQTDAQDALGGDVDVPTLSKPWTIDELLRAVRRELDEAKRRQEERR